MNVLIVAKVNDKWRTWELPNEMTVHTAKTRFMAKLPIVKSLYAFDTHNLQMPFVRWFINQVW